MMRIVGMTRVRVRVPFTDARAAGLLEAKTSQLCKDQCIVLVMDISAAWPVVLQEWVPLIQRRFQPSLNTRFGAVALCARSYSTTEGATLENWVVLENSHARCCVPPVCSTVFA